MHQHRTITAYLEPTGLRTSTFEGRQHLVAPVVLMVGDIVVAPVTGDGRGEFVPSAVLQQAPSQWDGRPVIPGHPPTGSANTPARLEARRIGQLFATRFSGGRLVSEAWIDPARAEQVGADAQSVVSRLRDGQPVEISVGAWVTLEDAAGTAGGRRFGRRWVHVSADHLAMLPEGQPGACSIADGCGVAGRTSFMAAQARPTVEDVLEAVARSQYERESRRIRLAALAAPPPEPYTEALSSATTGGRAPCPPPPSTPKT